MRRSLRFLLRSRWAFFSSLVSSAGALANSSSTDVFEVAIGLGT
jgi:hypothetical protein